MYEYKAFLVRVVDGDTLHANVDLGMNICVEIPVRLYGINAPEMKTPEGKQAKQFVLDWFATHADDGLIGLRTIRDRKEKYGRYLGVVMAYDNDHILNDDLISAGHAVEYMAA